MMRARASVLACLLLLAAGTASPQDDVVMQAMKDELARSMERLLVESLDKPYFISYRVQERNGTAASATFGALVSRSENRSRHLAVELRVGNPKLDNANFMGMTMMRSSGVSSGRGVVSLPIEDDYKELRRQLWLATDGAYKSALEDISRKRAALQNKQRGEETLDFAAEPAATWADPAPPAKLPSLATLEALARELSTPFKETPGVQTSHVSVVATEVVTRFVNSEGTTYTRRSPQTSALVTAATQAPDGMGLEDFFVAYGRTFDELPKTSDLLAGVKDLGARLSRLREAPVLDRYNGPVLFEDQAAAEVFHQAFVSRLPAARRPILDNEAMGRAFEDNPLLEKLGAKVLPESMSLVDDPTLAEQGGKPLLGGYAIDEEGVLPRRTAVVEKGILKTLLTTRTPVRGIERSTGNRRGVSAAPSNLILVDEKGMPPDALKAELLKRVKERGKDYGIIVRRLGNSLYTASRETSFAFVSSSGSRDGADGARLGGAVVAYKVFPDGREDLVRNLEPSGLVPATFKEVVAAGKSASVYSVAFASRNTMAILPFLRLGSLPGDGANAVVSLVVPSLLFDDVTLQKPTREIPRPPMLKHPSFDKP